ncbi:lanthionine synthetase LanC family protein [Micromonospora sp. WMMA1363]|uniref:lanthionine synthetase LanC family protein n=1 Tax=Micromonospora sp. WMMA1363 TaxID=3053985 RepID=UPI00259CBAB1|nr:lanthionine synthetase LanC family protein [Micromonospora sp. WMMA1363]MDM4723397.1 lanthionine synthetase LanC family protein [Micromonospora sp. WMMA1363]
MLTYLARLTQPLTSAGPHRHAAVPPWWLAAGLTGEADPIHYPAGHGNLGVAHGISAIIALFSLAVLRDAATPDVPEALARLCAWTDQWRQPTDNGWWWPGYLTADPTSRRIETPQRPRPSWCYGIAGTARAQQLAGLALGETTRHHAAEAAILDALRDPAQRALLPDVGLCHGKAGLLQAAWRMTAHASTHHLADELPGLTDEITRQLSAGSVADPELLDGAAGAALALHTVGTGTVATDWDTVLLLA